MERKLSILVAIRCVLTLLLLFAVLYLFVASPVRHAQQAPQVPPVSSSFTASPCSQSALWQAIDAAVEIVGQPPSGPMSAAETLRQTVERAERMDQVMGHLKEVRDLCRGVPKENAK